MAFAEMRGLLDKTGRPVAMVCAQVLKRVVGSPPTIKVVVYDKPCPFFLEPTRHYSGLQYFPSVPPAATAAFLEHELLAGVPRNLMGKSIFDLAGRLYRIAFRAFGVPRSPTEHGLSDYLVVGSDIENAQMQLLAADWMRQQRPSGSVQLRISVIFIEGLNLSFFTSALDRLGSQPLPDSFLAYLNDRSTVLAQKVEEFNQVVSPPLFAANVKKFYISAQANSTLASMLAKSGRTLTVNPSDERVAALKLWLFNARRAAEMLSNDISRRFPAAGVGIMAYALDNNKDFTACMLRRRSNVLERATENTARRLNQPGTHLPWPSHVNHRVLLDTEHDGHTILRWMPHAVAEVRVGGIEAMETELCASLLDATGCRYKVQATRPSRASVNAELNQWLLEHGHPSTSTMHRARVR